MQEDRLGSVGKFYPYGEARVGDPKRFATYERDEGGLDYAVNRYYWVGMGRFMSGDPYMASGGVAEPGSWNRYGYVGGDPVNRNDPKGLWWEYIGSGYTTVGEGEYQETVRADVYIWHDAPALEQSPQEVGERLALSNRDLLEAAVQRAKEALKENEDCQKLFGNDKTRANGFDPSSILDKIAAGTFGTLTFEDKGAKWGVANVSPDGVPKFSSVTITINSCNDGSLAYWNLGRTDFNAATLLHELGHVYDLTRGSGNSILRTPDAIPIIGSKRSAWNDWKVDQDCFNGVLGYKKP